MYACGDDEHLCADKGEHDGEADLEVMEFLDHSGQQKIERAQAQDSEDVRGINDKSIRRDGEDGRDRVDGENQVRDFDDDQNEQQQRTAALPVDARRISPRNGASRT